MKLSLILLSALLASGCAKEEGPAPFKISGTIQLAPELKPRAKPFDTIFLIARPAEGGRPLAVQRFEGNVYPIEFTLNEQNFMVPGTVVEAPVNLSVRVDKDGDPLTRGPGDLECVYDKNPVAVDAQGVVLTVDSVIK